MATKKKTTGSLHSGLIHGFWFSLRATHFSNRQFLILLEVGVCSEIVFDRVLLTLFVTGRTYNSISGIRNKNDFRKREKNSGGCGSHFDRWSSEQADHKIRAGTLPAIAIT